MHILEKYALDSLARIEKPYIFEKYFPIPFEKYITFQPENKNRQKYIYWSDVIDLINPYLMDRNINIVQLNGNQINGCFDVSKQTDFNSKAYIVKNSMLHFGVEGFCAQTASFFGKNIVTLYGDYPPENKKPYWSSNTNLFNLYRNNDVKPLYNLEGMQSINEIRPENIAKGILGLLDIKYKEMINTYHIGRNYTNKTFEIIPDAMMNTPDHIPNLIIRMDYFHNEKALPFYLMQKKCSIITDKPINLELLKAYKENIISIIYFIEENNDPLFIEDLKSAGIQYEMVSYLEEEDLNKFKLKYLDFGLIFKKTIEEIPNIKKNNKQLFFKSSRVLASKDGIFSTKYHWQNKIKINQSVEFSLDMCSRDFENLYIYSIDR
ncbi:hypothetical protein EBU95_07600 [bacterium]|nr:hypothetical protein [bacterium]